MRTPQRIELRSDEPPPTGTNTSQPDLVFLGVALLEVEREWSGVRGDPLDGEILDRVAIYRDVGLSRLVPSQIGKPYVAEERRYNLRAIFVPDPLPLLSRSRRFETLPIAADWLRDGFLLEDAELRQEFEAHLERLTG